MKPHTSNIFCQKSTLFKEYTLCVGCYNASPVTEGFLLKFSGMEILILVLVGWMVM